MMTLGVAVSLIEARDSVFSKNTNKESSEGEGEELCKRRIYRKLVNAIAFNNQL